MKYVISPPYKETCEFVDVLFIRDNGKAMRTKMPRQAAHGLPDSCASWDEFYVACKKNNAPSSFEGRVHGVVSLGEEHEPDPNDAA